MLREMWAKPEKLFVLGCLIMLAAMTTRSVYPFDAGRVVIYIVSGLGYATVGLSISQMICQAAFRARYLRWKSVLTLCGLLVLTSVISIMRIALAFRIGYEIFQK